MFITLIDQIPTQIAKAWKGMWGLKKVEKATFEKQKSWSWPSDNLSASNQSLSQPHDDATRLQPL